MDYLALAERVVAIAGAVVTVASAVCALTPTPDPATVYGRVYRAIETLALLVGRAKELGVMPRDPAADRIEAVAADIAKEAKPAA